MSSINIHTVYKESVTVPIDEATSFLESAESNANGLSVPAVPDLGVDAGVGQEIAYKIRSAINTLSGTKGSICSYLDGFDNAERSIEACLRITTGSSYSLVEKTLYDLHDARYRLKHDNKAIQKVYDPSYPSYYNYVYKSLDNQIRKQVQEQLNNNASGNRVDPNTFIRYYQTIFPYCGITYGKQDITVSENACGITCGAMILTNLCHQVVTPKDIIDVIGNDYTGKSEELSSQGWGTNTQYLYDIFNKTELNDAEKIHIDGHYVNCPIPPEGMEHMPAENLTNVLDGNTVVLVGVDGEKENARVEAGGERLFTSIGHYILITGVDEEGNYIVADPNGFNSFGKNYDERHFTPEELNGIVAGYTIFSYDENDQ